MHHLEAQFSFEDLRGDLREMGVGMMQPFSNFSYLHQAFTEPEVWPVDLDRLEALSAGEHLRAETVRDIAEAFRFLMGLRMNHQARQILDRLEPDNRIDPETLEATVRKQLKTVFTNLKAWQAALDHEFKGV